MLYYPHIVFNIAINLTIGVKMIILPGNIFNFNQGLTMLIDVRSVTHLYAVMNGPKCHHTIYAMC